MGMTVYQFKCAVEEMRTVYNFDDNETRIDTQDLRSYEHNCVELQTVDKQTGIAVFMRKVVNANDYVERDPRTNKIIDKEDYE